MRPGNNCMPRHVYVKTDGQRAGAAESATAGATKSRALHERFLERLSWRNAREESFIVGGLPEDAI